MNGRGTVSLDMTRADEELVGINEIAERAHRSKQAVWGWTKYSHMNFPQPIAVLSQGSVWRWGDVRRWLEERERTVKK